MNPQLLEMFFVSYLKEKKLKYSLSSRIYTIELDVFHKKLYGCEKLICTFDQNLAKQKNITLIALGTFIFDSMISQYVSSTLYSYVDLPLQKYDLVEVNDRLKELHKEMVAYNINESQNYGVYILFDVFMQTVKKKKHISIPVLITPSFVCHAKDFEQNTFTIIKKDLHIEDDYINKGLSFCSSFLEKDINDMEESHDQNLKELSHISEVHSEDLYKELHIKEQKVLNSIETTKEKAMRASTFALKDKYNFKIKELTKKYNELLEKHKAKEQIQKDFTKQKQNLEHRELKIEAKILAYVGCQLGYYTIAFKDGETFYYVPSLNQFIKSI